LLLFADHAVPDGQRPEWVQEWLGSREQRAERAAARSARPDRPPDPEAQARRALRREERVAAGVEELRRWLADLVRRGLAEAQRESWDFFDQPAARMVDAQAPGLASRVRRIASARVAGDEWAERTLEEAALLGLLLEAYGRLDELPEATGEDVRQQIGWTVPTEQVLAGERVRDEWASLGQVVVEDERLRSQRTWLYGIRTGRSALLLAFAAGTQLLDPGVPPGTALDASLAFYPGAAPLRALIAERHGEPAPLERLPGHPTVEALLAARAGALAAQPWTDRFPAALQGVVPARDGDEWVIADSAGGALALGRRADAWTLLAVSGGHAVDVFGELEGERLRPLSVAADGRVVALA
jgi:hypothetical protein